MIKKFNFPRFETKELEKYASDLELLKEDIARYNAQVESYLQMLESVENDFQQEDKTIVRLNGTNQAKYGMSYGEFKKFKQNFSEKSNNYRTILMNVDASINTLSAPVCLAYLEKGTIIKMLKDVLTKSNSEFEKIDETYSESVLGE